MWIGHFLLGIVFYLVTNYAIWIEHFHLLVRMDQPSNLLFLVHRGPNLVEAFAFFGFVYASVKQHSYHLYLSNLVKYTLPDEGAFRYTVAPHYTAECAIYLCLLNIFWAACYLLPV